MERVKFLSSDHKVYQVVDRFENPTYRSDLINYELPEEYQYPSPVVPHPRYIYDDEPEDLPDTLFDVGATPGYEVLRCARAGRELEDAQLWFDSKRVLLDWSRETPIYRTGRFYCKRIWR